MSTNNQENTSIHQFDFNLICEYFSSIKHQGPGSSETTQQALQFIKGLTPNAKIVDLGCGTGSQTITLIQSTPCHITALDLFPQFIEKLNTQVSQLGLQKRVDTVVGSMEALPFKEPFDVIWSEGAIYNIGFQRGLSEWRKFIKPNGYLAVTESSWFTEQRPAEIEAFWTDAYPEMDTIPHKVAQIQEAGYRLIACFSLPETCWTNNYYIPQQEAQRIFLKKHPGNPTAEELVKNQRYEAELYSKYHSYYGYVFYIAQRID